MCMCIYIHIYVYICVFSIYTIHIYHYTCIKRHMSHTYYIYSIYTYTHIYHYTCIKRHTHTDICVCVCVYILYTFSSLICALCMILPILCDIDHLVYMLLPLVFAPLLIDIHTYVFYSDPSLSMAVSL